MLFRYAITRLNNASQAQDAVQETFLSALKSRDKFSGKSSERTWLIGILKHKIVDLIRKESRERPYEDLDLAKQLDESDERFFDKKGHWRTGPSEWHINPRKSFEQAEFWDVLTECLSHLQDRLHKAFTLRELEHLSAEEICKTLGVSETNLWVILYRARTKLKACLEKNWIHPEGEKV